MRQSQKRVQRGALLLVDGGELLCCRGSRCVGRPWTQVRVAVSEMALLYGVSGHHSMKARRPPVVRQSQKRVKRGALLTRGE